jgi:hypothetical protein
VNTRRNVVTVKSIRIFSHSCRVWAQDTTVRRRAVWTNRSLASRAPPDNRLTPNWLVTAHPDKTVVPTHQLIRTSKHYQPSSKEPVIFKRIRFARRIQKLNLRLNPRAIWQSDSLCLEVTDSAVATTRYQCLCTYQSCQRRLAFEEELKFISVTRVKWCD